MLALVFFVCVTASLCISVLHACSDIINDTCSAIFAGLEPIDGSKMTLQELVAHFHLATSCPDLPEAATVVST